MNGNGKSDRSIVPEKAPNKAPGAPVAAEAVEERDLASGNPQQRPRSRTQSRRSSTSKLWRIRQAAKQRQEERFTSLWHHIYDPERLETAYYALNRQSAPGVDGVSWQEYGKDLRARLEDLSRRLQRGAYRPKPVARTYIPKRDGRQRPIGKPALEDKIVQRAWSEVVGGVFEADFLGFSYGCRPGRNQHNGLDALSVGLFTRKVSWVLDADIRGFFEAIDHEWMMRFLQHRIADRRVLRQARQWLKAGVLEKGEVYVKETGTPQGGSVSPLLANIYLHYVLDLWAHRWRSKSARGDMIIVRYVDDFVVGFQYRDDATRFLFELKKRIHRFNLELHAEKTRLIEFGRFAAPNRRRRGVGKPETFNFLGFTHICSVDRKGKFIILRQTMRQRLTGKLKELNIELKKRRHQKLKEQQAWLRSVLNGHYRYYGVPRNYRALKSFYEEVIWYWWRALRRRSQKHRLTLEGFRKRARQWLPQPYIFHPYPDQRMRVSTWSRSPVR